MQEKDSIFTPTENTAERDHSRLIMALSGIAALIVIAAIIVVSSRSSGHSDLRMAQAGSAEFDSYAPFVKITNIDKATSTTLIGRRLGILKAVVTNTGDKTITGLQIRGLAVGFGGETLAQRVATPIPRVMKPLGPGQSANVTVQIDPIPDPSQIMDMTIQLYGLDLK
ncbi:MAG TPA: hypothetical protein VI756_24065 [Blastocatellia bacterium]